ncbi:MAG: signal peptidase I [Oscillospiraceae bacterium]|nr:signal peptidase I [Oscillospiraceae bacterium]
MFDDYQPKETTGRAAAREICDWVEAAMMAVVCVVLLFAFVARISDVDGISMLPTLEDQDRLVITRMGMGPSHGDIVVVTLPGRYSEPLVKRVIATEGQTIDINFETGQVLVDGRELHEPYIADRTLLSYDMTFPQIVPDGHMFMLGDNRNNSWDSRDSRIGMVDNRHILGRAVFRVFPYRSIGVP